MEKTPRNDRLILAFQAFLESQGRSQLTVRTYASEVERLSHWVGPGSLSDLGPAELGAYLMQGIESGDTPGTHNVRVAAIKKFCGWLVEAGLARSSAASDLHGQRAARPPVQYLPREAVRELLAVLAGNIRDTAIFLLLLSTGVRLREMVSLDREDFAPEDAGGQVAVRSSAGGARLVYPSDQAIDALLTYLRSRADRELPLFISRFGSRLAPRTVQGSFAIHFRRAGVPGSIQILRHTFGVQHAQSGVDSHDLQELMGYRTPESTRVYRTADRSRLRELEGRG